MGRDSLRQRDRTCHRAQTQQAVIVRQDQPLLSLTHLTSLDLGSNDFGGINIPMFIGSLVGLRSLNLTCGGFGGPIPHQLGNLSSLRRLELGDDFDGQAESFNYLKAKSLQWLSSLSSLEYLNMKHVNLSEASDHWLFAVNKIPSLLELHLSSCELRRIYFPPRVNLTSLEVLDLSENSLQGQVPWAMGNLTSLVSLNLDFNGLTRGNMPKSMGNLCSLEKFDFSGNILSGEVSKAFESLSSGCLSKSIKSLQFEAFIARDDMDPDAFTGQIPEVIGVFKSLVYLSLFGNNIYGPLPMSIGKLSALKSLDISFNRLSGHLPESIGSFSNLESLDLSRNKLSGPLPKCLGYLSNLKELVIFSNQLEGEVSEIHFANLTRLTQFIARDNKLTLKVSPHWIPFFCLDVIDLGSWKLGPQFPMWLRTQTNFSCLDLSNTGISDAVPSWFWNLSTRRPSIDLSQNQIYGQIPDLHGSGGMYLNSNKFNGTLPRIASEIEVLDLSNNSLSGDMSHFLCHPKSELPGRLELNLKDNLISGKIPDCWKYWSKIQVLVIHLSNNNLTGELPGSMVLLPDLMSLHLRNNGFTGDIPKFLQNCSNLIGLDLGLNNFVGKIPSWLGRLQNLQLLGLRSNKLTGDIPSGLCSMASLQMIDIANNNLSGVIPKCFENLTAMTTQMQYPQHDYFFYGVKITETADLVTKGKEMQYGSIAIYLVTMLDLSSNNLSGEIPEEITSLAGLQSLNLSRNSFRGHIPSRIGNLTKLESLDLSRNQLSGAIPSSVSGLTFLAYLDLSYNNLSGKIPTGTQLQGFEASGFVGNQLCGPPLTKDCGEGEKKTSGGVVTDSGEREDDEELWFRLGIVVGFGVGFLGIIIPLLCSRIWRNAYFWFFQEYLWYKIEDQLNYIFRN